MAAAGREDERTGLEERLLEAVRREITLPSDVTPSTALEATLGSLARGLSAGPAADLLPSLPPAIRRLLRPGDRPRERLDREAYLRRVADQLGVTRADAETLARGVFAALRARLPVDKAEEVASQMPRSLADLWLGSRPAGRNLQGSRRRAAPGLQEPARTLDRSKERRAMKTVRDVMVGKIVTVEPSASLLDAANRMREANVGMLPIVESGRLRGVLTDRDLVVRGIARNLDPAATPVVECATEDPLCAEPDWDVDQCLQAMAREQVGRLPVVDSERRIVGVVTLSSLLLRGEDEGRALETARRVSERSAKRPSEPAPKGPVAAARRRGPSAAAKPAAKRARRGLKRAS
jgi:CBS domain-containing protein